jgi:preprotein translocase subunit SecG
MDYLFSNRDLHKENIMNRILAIFLLLFFGLTFNVMAQQSSGGGNSDIKDTCEISGGTFTGSESGNWVCCWADWGCYGCVDGNCKIKCYNERCRKANGIGRVNTGTTSAGGKIVNGLAPQGMKAPVAPIKKQKPMKTPLSNTIQK